MLVLEGIATKLTFRADTDLEENPELLLLTK